MVYRHFLSQTPSGIVRLRNATSTCSQDLALSQMETLTTELKDSSPREFGIHASVDDLWCPFNEFKTLFCLAKVCQLIRSETMPMIHQNLDVFGSTVQAACWYGVTSPFITAQVKSLMIANNPLPKPGKFLPWIQQVIKHYPNLEELKILCVRPRKQVASWGTQWALEDLRVMQYILENSKLNVVMDGIHFNILRNRPTRNYSLLFDACGLDDLATNRAHPTYIDPTAELANAMAKRPTKVSKRRK